jgi:hypothetical protein
VNALPALLGRPDRHAIWTGKGWAHQDGQVPWAAHLAGQVLAGGVYGGCQEADSIGWDIDGHDEDSSPEDATLALRAALPPSVVPMIVTSKSGVGYHVRVFFSRAIPTDTARALARQIKAAVNRPAEMCAVIPARANTPKGSGGVFGLPFAGPNAAVKDGGCTLLDPDTLDFVSTEDALDALPFWPLTDPELLLTAFPLPAAPVASEAETDDSTPAPERALARALAYAQKREVGAPGSPEHRTLSVALFAWSVGCNAKQRLDVLRVYNARRPAAWPESQLIRLVEAPRTFGRERGWRTNYEASLGSIGQRAPEPAPAEAEGYSGKVVVLPSVWDTLARAWAKKASRPDLCTVAPHLQVMLRGEPLCGPDEDLVSTVERMVAAMVNAQQAELDASATAETFHLSLDGTGLSVADVTGLISRAQGKWKARAAAEQAKNAAKRPAPTKEVRVVERSGRFYVSTDGGADYRYHYGKDSLSLKMREILTLPTTPKYDAIADHIRAADSLVNTYCQSETTFDGGTLMVGLRLEGRLEPKWDAAVDGWLRALAGEQYPALEQQIVACAPAHLNQTARLTFLWGPKSVGKSVLVAALANAWGVAPVSAETVIDRFNGSLGSCPVVLADEALPKELTGERLREFLTSHSHWIERKGQEKTRLTGCVRFWAVANSEDQLRFAGSKSYEDIQAIGARITSIHVLAEAEEALDELRQGANVDLDRITAHVLALWASVSVECDGRFVGAPSTGTEATALLDAELEDSTGLWDAIGRRLRDRTQSEAAYSDQVEVSAPVPGRPSAAAWAAWPIIVVGGRLFVRPTVLESAMGMKRAELQAALGPARDGRETIHGKGRLTRDVKATRLRLDVVARSMGLSQDALERLLERDSRD